MNWIEYLRLAIFLLLTLPISVFAQSENLFFDSYQGNYIGGLKYADVNSTTAFVDSIPSPTYVIESATEFLETLKIAKSGDVLFLSKSGDFNFSGKRNIVIPAGVTICGDRGRAKSLGAKIYTDSLHTYPLFLTGGPNVKFFGLRICGPDGNRINPKLQQKIDVFEARGEKLPMEKGRYYAYGLANSSFLHISHPLAEIENCEVFDWSYAAIYVLEGGSARVSFSYIHHNQRQGLGYGVCVDKGTAEVFANIFDYNRHAIAGTGRSGTSYIARYNIVLPNASSHYFDMHGGKNRQDGTDIAGDSIIIKHNLFYTKNQRSVLISGLPNHIADIENNVIVKIAKTPPTVKKLLKSKRLKAMSTDEIKKQHIMQVNKWGNFELKNNILIKY